MKWVRNRSRCFLFSLPLFLLPSAQLLLLENWLCVCSNTYRQRFFFSVLKKKRTWASCFLLCQGNSVYTRRERERQKYFYGKWRCWTSNVGVEAKRDRQGEKSTSEIRQRPNLSLLFSFLPSFFSFSSCFFTIFFKRWRFTFLSLSLPITVCLFVLFLFLYFSLSIERNRWQFCSLAQSLSLFRLTHTPSPLFILSSVCVCPIYSPSSSSSSTPPAF